MNGERCCCTQSQWNTHLFKQTNKRKHLTLFYEVDEIEAYYVEGSKPKNETPIEYTQIYTLNLEGDNKDPVSQKVTYM